MIGRWSYFLLVLFGAFLTSKVDAQNPVDYDIVYVRAPRYGDDTNTRWPEIKDPIHMEPGADLMLLHPDGNEEVLVEAGDDASIVDPYVSFDGKWVYYAKFHNLRNLNPQRRSASRSGSDIYKINVETRETVRLTHQEWTPLEGAANWSSDHLRAEPTGSYYLGYGIFNLGPCPLPGGKIMFTSSRNGHLPNKDYTFPNLQLFVMDEDGKNIELVGHLNIGSALHPTILMDGRVMFSSYESQGLRDQRDWGLWSIYPDGRNWGPLMSSFLGETALHFQTQLSNGDIAVVEYYNQNNNGFGTIVAFPSSGSPEGVPPFGDPDPFGPRNPVIPKTPAPQNAYNWRRYSFSPYGLYGITAFSHGADSASGKDSDGIYMGKVTHPSAAPGNSLLMVWSSGPANHLNRPTPRPYYDGGIYVLPANYVNASNQPGLTFASHPVNHPRALVKLKDDPNYNEMQPKALVPYRRTYGIDQPKLIPWLPNDGSKSFLLPKGTPHGLVGTSSFYKRNTAPYTGRNGPNELTQMGGDIGKYDDLDIHAVRILSMEPAVHRGYGPGIGNARIVGFRNIAGERLRILGEIPLRKQDSNGNPVMDVDGNPDTSFLAKIPANVPFTFQTVDKDGMALNISQTWHQLRPGEVRNNCGGCHAHAQVGTKFEDTAASKPGYQATDLTKETTLLTYNNSEPAVRSTSKPLDVEFTRDIKPILERSCVQCHNAENAQGGLALDGNAYTTLLGAEFRGTKYARPFQSRRSELVWKIFGRVTDGGQTEFSGTVMPPPGSGVPALTPDERMTIVRWIDLGGPLSLSDTPSIQWESKNWGWFMDALRPTATVSSPRAGINTPEVSELRIGLFDYYSGLEMGTFSVKADFVVNGNPAGTDLSGQFSEVDENVWSLPLSTPLTNLENGTLTVSIADKQGNIERVVRSFSVQKALRPSPPSEVLVRGDS